ncbi:hypothetical protein L2E82_32358 [Cichorium intybus]|uniref:Uncharacterized protein n=1 Tax=Cichorium intybus TaxID=13427 RepID=A0ACB9BFQ9_CICIN|nr:hypothetical protein L2E82_32358 [Cichorium intybus]
MHEVFDIHLSNSFVWPTYILFLSLNLFHFIFQPYPSLQEKIQIKLLYFSDSFRANEFNSVKPPTLRKIMTINIIIIIQPLFFNKT